MYPWGTMEELDDIWLPSIPTAVLFISLVTTVVDTVTHTGHCDTLLRLHTAELSNFTHCRMYVMYYCSYCMILTLHQPNIKEIHVYYRRLN